MLIIVAVYPSKDGYIQIHDAAKRKQAVLEVDG